jgi:hypothetical protein
MEYITGFVALAFAAVFAAAAFSRATAFAPHSRLDLVLTGTDAVAALLLARTLMPWASLPPLLWLLPVAVVAVGAFGSVLRWRSLPALRPDRSRRRSIVTAALHGAVYLLLLFVLFG